MPYWLRSMPAPENRMERSQESIQEGQDDMILPSTSSTPPSSQDNAGQTSGAGFLPPPPPTMPAPPPGFHDLSAHHVGSMQDSRVFVAQPMHHGMPRPNVQPQKFVPGKTTPVTFWNAFMAFVTLHSMSEISAIFRFPAGRRSGGVVSFLAADRHF